MKYTNFLIFITLLILLTLAKNMNDIRYKADNFFILSSKLEELKQLNIKLDSFISKKLNYNNFDEIEYPLRRTKEIFKEITSKKLFPSFNQSKLREGIITIQHITDKKISLINKNKSYSAILNNSLRYIITLHDTIEQTSLEAIFNSILTLEYNSEADPKKLLLKLREANTVSQDEQIFVKHAIIILEYYQKSNLLYDKTNELKLDKRLQDFYNYYEDYYYNAMQDVKIILITLTLMFLVVLILLIRYSIVITRQQEDLSMFKNAVSLSDNSIIITDKSHKITYVNKKTITSTGFNEDELIGVTPKILQSGLQDKLFYDNLNKTISSGNVWIGEFINMNKNGSLLFEKTSIIPIKKNNSINGYLALKLDITKEREIEQSLIKKHYYDELTELPNKNQLIIDMSSDKTQVLLLIDINAFNNINDYYGHTIGDTILIQFAQYLSKFITDNNYNAKLYKLNTDEFYIYTSDPKYIPQLIDITQKLIKQVSLHEFKINEFDINIDINVGLSYITQDTIPSSIDIFMATDLALKESKLKKLNYTLFKNNNKYQIEYIENIEMLKTLKEAIKDDRIIPFFQPIIDTKTKEVYSYEVLVRLINKNGTIISPYYFLEVSKKYKIYTSITKIVIQKAFRKFKNSKKKFSINLSYEDIKDENMTKFILSELLSYKYRDCISFEILESESIADFDKVKKFISTVQKLGCKIYLDDFGAGYSNFERIFKLNIDVLKIDGSIIQNIDKDENLKVIAKTVVSLAKASKMKVVAEYVHSKDVSNIVEAIGVDYLQGFYYAEPTLDI